MKMKKTHLMKQLILMLVISMQFFVTSGSGNEVNTTVSVHPADLTVALNDTFTVSIRCAPAQAMKSFELSLSFDQTILEAKNVVEGDIFDGYSTFFNEGTINNTNGEIISIYNLIIGQGTVSEAGDLVQITFSSKLVEGTTEITLFNVGVTNETQYIPITVSNGSVSVTHTIPSIHDVSLVISDPIDTEPSFGWFNFSCMVHDAVLGDVFLILSHPDGSETNSSLIALSDETFFLNLTGLSHGAYSYVFYVPDIQGNHVFSESYYVLIPPNWDITMNRIVNLLDLLHVSYQYGQAGTPGWIREDVNNDGVIDLLDIIVVSEYYHQVW